MPLRTWKQVIALVLTFDLALSPLAANAFVGPPPKMPTKAELQSDRYLREMLERREHIDRGEFPAFNEKDLDPWGIQGQYVNLYDRDGNIIDQYFLGQESLGRQRPNFTSLTPMIDEKTGCLVIEGTAGADAKGENGYRVARLHVPKMCNLATVTFDKERLTMVDHEGRVHLGNFGYITNRAFTDLIWFKRDAVRLTAEADYTQSISSEILTIGSRPITPDEIAPDALLPDYNDYDDPRYDPKAGPVFTAGDVAVKVGGKVVAVLSERTSTQMLLSEKQRIFALTTFQRGSAADLQFLREYIERAELKVEAFEKMIRDDESLKAEPAVADLLAHMGPAQMKEFKKQMLGFEAWAKRKNDRFDMADWNKTWNVMFERAAVLNADKPEVVTDAYMQKNWKQLLEKNFQTLEQQAALTKETTASKIRRNAAEYARLGGLLAGLAAFSFFPMAVENSAFLKQFALVNWTYNMWPNVLKDAAYRMPLISSTFLLTMTVYLPGLISIGAMVALKGLNKAAVGSGRVATKIRDATNFWVSQENWQRIATFGYVVGGLTIITPLIRIVEGLFQQKELLSAMRLHQAPWRVVKPDSAVGRRMNLDSAQTLGLTTPSFYGAWRKLKTFNPFGGDLGAKMWQQQRHEFKQRLQLEVNLEKERVRDFSRYLAFLAVAEQEGVDPVTIQQMLSSKTFSFADLKEKLFTKTAIEDAELAQDKMFKALRKSAFEFNYGSIAGQLDYEEMQKHFLTARDIARKIKTADAKTKMRQHLLLKYKRRGLFIWDKALNQGREEAAFLKGRVASSDVWPNARDGYFPDTWMVTIVPAFFNVPILHTRADLSNPDQLAAKVGALGNINPKHMQDRAFNDTMQLAIGPAIDGCTFEVEEAIAETNYTPRERVANQVSVLDGAGDPVLTYPDATGAGGRYQGFLHEQKMFEFSRENGFQMPALKQYLKSARTNLDLGQQAKNHLNASFSTVWSFMAFQFVARMGLGDQALLPSVLGMTFVFASAPIFYKWWWWILKPSNNYYKRDMFGTVDRFFDGLAELDAAKDRPPGEGRDQMQSEGIEILHAIFTEFAPEKIDEAYHPALSTKSRDELATYWRNLAHTSPPRILPNASIPRWAMRIGALGSTVSAIPMLVMATMPKYQTFTAVAQWIGISALFQTSVIQLLSRKSAARSFIGDVFRKVTGRKAPDAGTPKTPTEECDDKLAS